MARDPAASGVGGPTVSRDQRLPDFTVRVSKRAKRARLTVDAQNGLVVVMPHRSKMDPAVYVESNLRWVQRALGSVADERSVHLAGPEGWLPSRLTFPAIGVDVPVEYRVTDSSRVQARLQGEVCTVMGDVDDAVACVRALRSLLTRIARKELPPLVDEAVKRLDPPLVPSGIRVASPLRRWASCSPRGTIMLARNLLFLDRELVDHVIAHEIAHLAVPDHSARFHKLVATYDPHAKRHVRELAEAKRTIPAWADGILPGE